MVSIPLKTPPNTYIVTATPPSGVEATKNLVTQVNGSFTWFESGKDTDITLTSANAIGRILKPGTACELCSFLDFEDTDGDGFLTGRVKLKENMMVRQIIMGILV